MLAGIYLVTSHMQEIIQLKVSLLQSKPPVWRQILVHKDTTFFELHHIVQIAIGWDNYHMFEFDFEGYRIGELDEAEDGYGSDQLLNSGTVTLSDIITEQKDTFKYLYDFGDNWKHQIKVEKFINIDPIIKYPACIDGQMNCPPEDCGGIDSFITAWKQLKTKNIQIIKKLLNGLTKNIILNSLIRKK